MGVLSAVNMVALGHGCVWGGWEAQRIYMADYIPILFACKWHRVHSIPLILASHQGESTWPESLSLTKPHS